MVGGNLESLEEKSKKGGILNCYWIIAVAVALVGPFAIPLVVRNPRLSKRVKWIVSILIIVLTIALLYLTKVVFVKLQEQLLDTYGL